jgi:hypothetical protein
MYVNTRTAGDIATTAAEGGIGYWSQIRSYRPRRWLDADGKPKQVARDFVFYSIAERDEAGYAWNNPSLVHAVTPDVIQRGVNLFLTGRPTSQARAVTPILFGEDAPARIRGQVNFQPRPFADMEDLSAMDADEADCVIQLGLFGKLVYG